MHTNECWACKESRAVCNHTRPRCSRCTKHKITCQYGLRLSWPKTTNKKRSLTHSLRGSVRSAKRSSQTSFVNASLWDIQLHEYLRTRQGLGNHDGYALQRLDPPMALSWLPINLRYEERGLLDHFLHMSSSTLAVFEPDRNGFLSLLVRLALSDSSPSSKAVLQSALALSSFHRYGLQVDVFRFKAGALQALITTSNRCVQGSTVVQHVAASMILCHLEMHGMTTGVSLWFCHLTEARRLIDNTGLDNQHFQGETSRLLDWVEYHMALSRFSHRHWYKKAPIQGSMNFAPVEESCHSRKIKKVSHCSQEILRLFYNMFEMIRQPTDSEYHSDEYEASLRCLENRISNIVPVAPATTSDTVSSSITWVATMELFKLAVLIYLKRASRNFSGTSPQIDEMVDRAYRILDDLKAFNLAFTLLIIGCEARTDEQRRRILEYIERARKNSSLKSLHGLQDVLQQIWVQGDLAVDYELDYLSCLDAVISSYRIMPSFV